MKVELKMYGDLLIIGISTEGREDIEFHEYGEDLLETFEPFFKDVRIIINHEVKLS